MTLPLARKLRPGPSANAPHWQCAGSLPASVWPRSKRESLVSVTGPAQADASPCPNEHNAARDADVFASLQALCSRPATSDIDCIRLGGMASILASTSLADVIAQVSEEQTVLQKGVGDFETSSAASQMALVSQAPDPAGLLSDI